MSNVQPYAFGQSANEPPEAISWLDRLGDKLARRLRALVESYSGGRPIVTAKPIDKTMFMMWDACVPAFTSISLYRMHPIKGVVTLRIDAALISMLVDRFYGGSNTRTHAERHEFTPTEVRLLNRLSTQVVDALTLCWADLVTLEPTLVGRETGLLQAEILPGDANVIVQTFEIDLGGHDRPLIELVYAQDGFVGLELGQGERVVEERLPDDPAWRTRLAQRLDDVRLPARTVLARPNLKLSELVALQPGDVIPIQIARQLPLLIGERVFAHGTIGEQDGCAAFMIERLA